MTHITASSFYLLLDLCQTLNFPGSILSHPYTELFDRIFFNPLSNSSFNIKRQCLENVNKQGTKDSPTL